MRLSFYADPIPELHLTPETQAEGDHLRKTLADQGAEFCPDSTAVLRCQLEGLSLDLLLGKECGDE